MFRRIEPALSQCLFGPVELALRTASKPSCFPLAARTKLGRYSRDGTYRQRKRARRACMTAQHVGPRSRAECWVQRKFTLSPSGTTEFPKSLFSPHRQFGTVEDSSRRITMQCDPCPFASTRRPRTQELTRAGGLCLLPRVSAQAAGQCKLSENSNADEGVAGLQSLAAEPLICPGMPI